MTLNERIVVILSGGEGRRMGGADKGALVFDGRRLIDHVVARLQPQADRVIISGRHDYGTGLETVPDLADGPKGPAAGLWAMLNQLSHADGFFTAPVDGPFAPSDLVARLYSKEHSAVAFDGERLHPTYAWWRMEDLRETFGGTPNGSTPSLHAIAEKAGAARILFEDARAFMNINRPEDLEG